MQHITMREISQPRFAIGEGGVIYGNWGGCTELQCVLFVRSDPSVEFFLAIV